LEACANVGGEEYKDICGGCDPKRCVNVADVPTKTNNPKKVEVDNGGCAPCSSAVCESDLNRCPPLNAPYLCYSGQNHGKKHQKLFFFNSLEFFFFMSWVSLFNRWLLSSSMGYGWKLHKML